MSKRLAGGCVLLVVALLAVLLAPSSDRSQTAEAGTAEPPTAATPTPEPTATESDRGVLTASGGFVQRPATLTLSWQVEGAFSSLEILPDLGDVRALTTDGAGETTISPLGEVEYRLVVDGEQAASRRVVGLPVREKVHLYLLIGQSNMAGYAHDRDPVLDAEVPRVLQFGSRDGMEQRWERAQHPLVELGSAGDSVGMGLEFARTVLAAEPDPEVVVGLINHAYGGSAIQWWAPGAEHSTRTRPDGSAYHLYDEAVQRTREAERYGVLRGVLWHQGEYNSAPHDSGPAPEPERYAARLHALVDDLRTDLDDPALPFVSGGLVPERWVSDGELVHFDGLPYREPVERALATLPNERARTGYVSNQGLRGISDDKIHFDAESQRELGRRYAAALGGLAPVEP